MANYRHTAATIFINASYAPGNAAAAPLHPAKRLPPPSYTAMIREERGQSRLSPSVREARNPIIHPI